MAWYRCGGTPSEVLSLPTPSEASGAIARFNTDLTENLLSAVAEFSASQASGTPTPAAPIPIVGVDKVNITRTGKNLFNSAISNFINTSIKTWGVSDANIVAFLNTLKEGTYKLTYKIKVDAINGTGTDQYGIIISNSQSGQIRTRETESNVTVGSIFTRDATITITTSNKGLFENCWFYTGRSPVASSDNCTFYDMQLEVGSTATTYEPYNGTTALINLGGTYFGGYIDVVTGKITLTYKKVVFNGDNSEGWNFDTSGTKARVYTNAVSNIKVSNLNIEGNIISPNASIIAYPDEWKCCVGATGRFIIGVDSTITSKTDWQTYLSNNNLDVKFELETPIVVYAMNTAEIPTIVGDNQVFADSGNIAVKFLETVGHKI